MKDSPRSAERALGRLWTTIFAAILIACTGMGIFITCVRVQDCPVDRHGPLDDMASACPRCADKGGITLWNKWFWYPRSAEEEQETVLLRRFGSFDLGGDPSTAIAFGELAKISESVLKARTLKVRFRADWILTLGGVKKQASGEGSVLLKGDALLQVRVRLQDQGLHSGVQEGWLVSDGREFSYSFQGKSYRESAHHHDFCSARFKGTLVPLGVLTSLALAACADDPSNGWGGGIMTRESLRLSAVRETTGETAPSTLTYQVHSLERHFPIEENIPAVVRLDFDPRTHLPRTLTISREDLGFQCREIYEEFVPEAAISDEDLLRSIGK